MNKKPPKYTSLIIAVLYLTSTYVFYPIIGNDYLMISIIPLILITWFYNLIFGLVLLVLSVFNIHFASQYFESNQILFNQNAIIGLTLAILIILFLSFIKKQLSHLNTTESFLKNAKIRLDTMISNTSDVIGILNKDAIIMFKTSNIEKFFGWRPDELVGQTASVAIHPDDTERCIQDFNSLIGHKDKTISVEYRYKCKDGSYRNIALYAKNLIHNQHINGILINYRDITEKKRAQQEIKENEYKYRTLFEKSTDVVCMIDNYGNIIDINDAGIKLFGYSKAEFLKMNVKHLLHPVDVEKSNLYFKKLETEGFYSMYEGRIVTKTGKTKWIQVNSTSFYKDGEKIGSQDIIRDITLQKTREEELKASNKTKSKLFSIMSHDLRNPLGSISGFSELIIKRVTQKNWDNVKEFAELIYQASTETEKLLSNLLQWSRAQMGSLKYTPEAINLAMLITHETSAIKTQLLQKEIKLVVEIPGNEPITADANMLSTVIRNLLTNAIKFTPNGGEIKISTIKTENDLHISISDTGIGIPTDRISKLFVVDQNLSTSGTNNEKGTGLGLVLCKEFIELHKGKIWVESQLKKGSTFYVSLPY